MDALIQIGISVGLILVGYFAGRSFEKKHYASIREREEALAGVVVTPTKHLPGLEACTEGELVLGAVVISIDYFKRFAAGLRNLFGGRVASYETVIDRARREAQLRMKEQAVARGYNAVVCTRIETSRLASSYGNNQGIAGLEIVAFGTAVRLPPA